MFQSLNGNRSPDGANDDPLTESTRSHVGQRYLFFTLSLRQLWRQSYPDVGSDLEYTDDVVPLNEDPT